MQSQRRFTTQTQQGPDLLVFWHLVGTAVIEQGHGGELLGIFLIGFPRCGQTQIRKVLHDLLDRVSQHDKPTSLVLGRQQMLRGVHQTIGCHHVGQTRFQKPSLPAPINRFFCIRLDIHKPWCVYKGSRLTMLGNKQSLTTRGYKSCARARAAVGQWCLLVILTWLWVSLP